MEGARCLALKTGPFFRGGNLSIPDAHPAKVTEGHGAAPRKNP